jgi:hypothetical protein
MVTSRIACALGLAFAGLPIATSVIPPIIEPTCSCHVVVRASELPGGFEVDCRGGCDEGHPICDDWVQQVVYQGQLASMEGCACMKLEPFGWYWCNEHPGGLAGNEYCEGHMIVTGNSVIVVCENTSCSSPKCEEVVQPFPPGWQVLCFCGLGG